MLTPNLRHLTMQAPYIFQKTSSSQSNAVRADKGIPIDASDDLDTLTALGVYTFVRSGIPQNAPPDLIDGGKVYVMAGNSAVALRQKIVSVYGVEYSRTQNDPSSAWRAWTKTATAIPPQKFSLPLSAGWEAQSGGDAKYFKTQEDKVHVSMNVKSNTAVADGDTIATLPVGFRPASQLKIPIICKVSGQSALKFGHFDVTTNGAIRIYDAVTGSEIVTEIAVAPFTFDAAG